MLTIPDHVTICDVSLRDGLQAEKEFVPTDRKIALYEALLAAGVRHFEIGAFVSPKVIPQMQDTAQVLAAARKPQGTFLQALVPNLYGAERALETGVVDEFIFLSTASESYTRKNQSRTREEVFAALEQVTRLAHAHGLKVKQGIGMSFHCPYEGPTAPEKVVQTIERGLGAGASSFLVADSIGTATPREVQSLLRSIYDRWPDADIGLHLHDNRGQALANVLAGIDVGCRYIDAAVGGLGGTPIYAGSMGNVCLEDIVYMLDGMGVSTGMDVAKLVEAAALAERTVGHALPSRLLRAGVEPAKPSIP